VEQKLDELITGLQTFRKEFVQYGDLSDKNRRAIFALAETNEQLSQTKRELATATAGRDKAMLDNEQRHNDALRELQAQLAQLHKEIDEGKAELNAINAEIPKVQAHYDAIVRGINALTRQITNAAAAA
jgi:chromosome segregation ATPase